MSSKELAIRGLYGVLDSETLLLHPPEKMDDATVVMAWSVLDGLEKEVVKQRKAELREYLFSLAEENGTVNKNGSYVYAVPDSQSAKVTKERRKGKVSVLIDKLLDRFKNTDMENKLFKYTVEMTPVQYLLFRELVSLDLTDASEHRHQLSGIEGTMSLNSEYSLEGLVKAGEVDIDTLVQVTEIGEPTFALKVKKPSTIVDLLKSLKGK